MTKKQEIFNIYNGDEEHIVKTLTHDEKEIIASVADYYERKSGFTKTLIQKKFALKVATALRKTI